MRNLMGFIFIFTVQVGMAQFNVSDKTISGNAYFRFQKRDYKYYNNLSSDTIKISYDYDRFLNVNLDIGKGKFQTKNKLVEYYLNYSLNGNFTEVSDYDSMEVNRIRFYSSTMNQHNLKFSRQTSNFVPIKEKFGYSWNYSYYLYLNLIHQKSHYTLSGSSKNPNTAALGIGANFNMGLWYKLNEHFLLQTRYYLFDINLDYSDRQSSGASNPHESNFNGQISTSTAINLNLNSIRVGLTYFIPSKGEVKSKK
jgi:hypothetical protein